jgi:enamine deaminase RidA (YjgF/YER057c/UK114 family)
MPVPPRWVEELVGGCAPGDARNGGVDVRLCGPAAHATTCIRDAIHLDARELRERVASAYGAVIESLETIARHPVRFWNFIPDIGAPMVADLDRYMVFNAGRHDAFSRRYGALGTASAVGIKGSDLSVHCLAMKEPGTPVENPRQTPAWQYSARYGPLPPCFSRATIVELAGRRTLLIGGTASVVGEDSRHAGQFDAQVDETLLNLEALVRTADGSPRDVRAPLQRLVDLRVYVASAAQAERVRELLVSRCPRARTIAVALAQVCRRELLVEIEGVAEL